MELAGFAERLDVGCEGQGEAQAFWWEPVEGGSLWRAGAAIRGDRTVSGRAGGRAGMDGGQVGVWVLSLK